MTTDTARLQLRWRRLSRREEKLRSLSFKSNWVCVYELVIPLDEHDIRRKKNKVEIALEICKTFTHAERDVVDYAPFRDGVHAKWDSLLLGGIPAFIVASDGRMIPHDTTLNPEPSHG